MTAGAASVRSVGRPRQTRVLRTESGSLTVCRSGRLVLRKVRIDCCGSRRSPSARSGTMSPAAMRGGEERRDGLVPLPGVHGQEEVVLGGQSARTQGVPEAAEGLRGELAGVEPVRVGECRDAAVGGEALAHGDPRQAIVRGVPPGPNWPRRRRRSRAGPCWRRARGGRSGGLRARRSRGRRGGRRSARGRPAGRRRRGWRVSSRMRWPVVSPVRPSRVSWPWARKSNGSVPPGVSGGGVDRASARTRRGVPGSGR